MSDAIPREGELVDRHAYARIVGIHDATVTTWMGVVVNPVSGRRGQYRVQLFSREDVLLGKAVRLLLENRRGELTLRQAAAIARGEEELPRAGHDPRDSPR